MDIKKEIKDEVLNVFISGRLDTNTAPELEASVNDDIVGIKELNFNLKNLDYISSAGLRVILKFHKQMTTVGGTLNIISPKDEVVEVFDMTGFSTFLTIKE
jgi:anti-sigma B factor antagonist